nr:unnamed protein product [Callosobruchus chinensis]
MSITEATINQYNSSLNAWSKFCSTNDLNVLTPSISAVLKFLTHQLESGLSYSTINTHRSPLSQILGLNLSQDFRIKLIYAHPYQNIVLLGTVVLNYIQKLPSSLPPLQQLTYKTTMLLALARGQQVQTLASIDLESLHNFPDRLDIHITKRLKTTHTGRTQKPYHPASTQTISRWHKTALKLSGIDVNLFGAHSTRHASTSSAQRKGVNYDSIRLAAGWTEKYKTFALPYNKPLTLKKLQFAHSVLSSEN